MQEIKLKMSRERLAGLEDVYSRVLDEYVPETDYEHLLHCHATVMFWRIAETLKKDFRTIKLKISAPEALAFCLLFEDYALEAYGLVVVTEIMAKIDRVRKNNKQLEHGRD